MGIGVAFGLAGLLLATQAAGEPARPLHLMRSTSGYTYFNRPAATLAEHDRDLLLCVAHASPVRSVDQQMGGGADMGLVGMLVGGAIADSADSGVMAASIENCMVVYGWRVVRLDQVEGQGLSRLPAAELREKLTPWIGAEVPHGDVVRIWKNDAANGSIDHFALRPGHTKRGQLSLLALARQDVADDAPESAARPKKPPKPKLDPKWKKGSIKPAEFGTAPAESGIVIIGLRGTGFTRGNGFIFRRMGPDPETRPAVLDHAPDVFSVMASGISSSLKTYALSLPPGRWRIASDVNGLMELNYCLGSPSFELKAGEVLYAGTLDLKSENLRPDLDLTRIREWLAGTAAAEVVKPAEYLNGSRGACGPNAIYALEFEGAEFEADYALGSKASKVATGADGP